MAEPIISEPSQKKRLALFLDGTWNAVDDNTNVWRLKSLCSGTSGDGARQLVYYEVGVNGFFGGAFGKGLDKVITDAYEWLIDHYNPGDEIFIFGFSRGAYAARSLAGLVAKCGLLRPGAALGVKQLYARYKRADEKTIWDLGATPAHAASIEEQWLLKYSQAIHINVVAVWDTVGALGVPFGRIRGVSRSTFGWLHTGLRLPIDHGFHALAIDEHRADFQPTLWTVRKPKGPEAVVAPARPLARVEQRWFIGAHANVGGGCESDLLAQIPLRWIMRKASLHGLAFRNDVDLDGDVLKAAIADSYRGFAHGAYARFRSRYYRPIGEAPKERDDGTHSNVNETIDASVFDRWRQDSRYRPPNLAEWAARHKVTLADLRNSVIADGPQAAAPD
jgi:uncharacterized protein (DUF2235 family)